MRRRSRSKGLFITLFVIMLVSSGLAQQPIKVGVVNSQEVLEKSAEGKRVMAQIQEKDKKNQDSLAKLDEDIRSLETRINTQRLTLTQEALINMSSDLEKKRTDRKRFAEDSLRELGACSLPVEGEVDGGHRRSAAHPRKTGGIHIICVLGSAGAVLGENQGKGTLAIRGQQEPSWHSVTSAREFERQPAHGG